MRKSKKLGGLGYRKFENFNIAMLAEQGWRLVQNPKSLVAQVLRAKYFSATDFLTVNMGSNPSYMRQSLLATKPLLEEGLLWRIGNDKTVSIWSDKWLPQQTTFKPQSSIRFLQVDIKVLNMIDKDTNQRKESLVDAIFSKEEVKLIKAILIRTCNKPDKLIWRYNNNAIFTIKMPPD